MVPDCSFNLNFFDDLWNWVSFHMFIGCVDIIHIYTYTCFFLICRSWFIYSQYRQVLCWMHLLWISSHTLLFAFFYSLNESVMDKVLNFNVVQFNSPHLCDSVSFCCVLCKKSLPPQGREDVLFCYLSCLDLQFTWNWFFCVGMIVGIFPPYYLVFNWKEHLLLDQSGNSFLIYSICPCTRVMSANTVALKWVLLSCRVRPSVLFF